MRFALALIVVAVLSVAAPAASAHPSPQSAVVLRLDRTGIDADLVLPIVELRAGWQRPVPMDAARAAREYGAELPAYVLAHVHPVASDGRPWTVAVTAVTPVPDAVPDLKVSLRMTPPPGAPVDRLTLNYDVILHQLVTHAAIVTVASDWRNGVLSSEPPALLGTIEARLEDSHPAIAIDRSNGSWFRGVAAVFHLGVRHIAEGTDHLLFLLALLLPAPLVARRWRWGKFAGTRAAAVRIFKIVTAFTVGHSVTLLLGALGWVHLPEPLIESAIAVSIFVSAVHAVVPLLRGKEAYVAAGFGLVHGLAFAATLTGFGFDATTMVSSVLAFNVGIEAVQVGVIVVTMPWLVLLSETPAYTPFRLAGGGLTAVAAATWFAERAFGWANPVGDWVERAAAHPWSIVGGLAVFASLAWLCLGPKEADTRTSTVACAG